MLDFGSYIGSPFMLVAIALINGGFIISLFVGIDLVRDVHQINQVEHPNGHVLDLSGASKTCDDDANY